VTAWELKLVLFRAETAERSELAMEYEGHQYIGIIKTRITIQLEAL